MSTFPSAAFPSAAFPASVADACPTPDGTHDGASEDVSAPATDGISARGGVSPEEAACNAQSQVLGSFNGPERALFEAHEDEVAAQLGRMAGVIEAHEDEVTSSWRARVSADVLLASSPAWSRRQFEDHIPDVVLVMCDKLRAWPDIASQHEKERDTARDHSKHRWQQGYDMRSLSREWGHLNGCLLEVLDRFWIDAPNLTLQRALRVAHSLVSELILESTSESVTEYARLLQAEAAGRARHMEQVIEALREEERSRGQVLREAAHDLRGSLGLVSGSASIIDRDQMEQGDRAEVGRILRRGVHSLHEMMTDLIDLARLEAGEEKASNRLFDAGQLLRSLGATALPLAQQKGLSLVLEGPDELSAWGDATKVRRIAQNLLLNAIKYTHQGGVTLAWGIDDDDRWLLRVSDTGPGLERSPAAPLAHALHEATNTSREVEGRTEGEQIPAGVDGKSPGVVGSTQFNGGRGAQDEGGQAQGSAASLATGAHGEGVGLSIVKRLCDLLGASIELDARSGNGSTFRVLFVRTPVLQPGSAQTASQGNGDTRPAS